MGKGDIKTKKGKRSNGSYGKHRARKIQTTKAASTKASATKKVATGTAPKRKPKASTPDA